MRRSLALLAGAFAAFVGASLWFGREAPAQQLSSYNVDIAAAPLSQQEVSLSFAPVVKRSAPAVVSIFTKSTLRSPREPLLELLFGRRFNAAPRQETSLGSGVIVRADGIVLTNAHVIEGADEITVALADRREFIAEVLLIDERTDLAVLEIEAAELPFLEFRDSDTMQVGDLVLAIGNPFGVGQTVTSGIVSAQTRTTPDGSVFLQTDAAINPGNSGGALVDMGGRLVGVNTMILSRSGGSNGIGFAIPADLAQQAIRSAEQGARSVARGWLGVEGQTVTQDLAESLGLLRPEGVILSSLHPLSSFSSAGLAQGDVVLDIDGEAVRDEAELAYRFGTVPLGSEARIGYLRLGARYDALVQPIDAPELPPRDVREIGGQNPLGGAVISNINPALSQELSLDASAQGVIILGIRRGFASRFGFRAGDVLRQVNGQMLDSVADVTRVMEATQGPWEFVLERKGRLVQFRVRA